MIDPHELKRLQVSRQRLEDARIDNAREAARIARELSTIERKLAKAGAEMRVSEHALLRYLERKYSLDLSQIGADLLKQCSECNGKYPVGDGLKAVVRDKTIVTVE